MTPETEQTLNTYLEQRAKLRTEFLDAIETARTEGATWEHIGALTGLGGRRQAQQWYRREKGRQ